MKSKDKMSIPNCTLITSCFDLTRFNPNCRSENETLNNFSPLSSLPCYMVIYCSKNLYEKILEKRKGLETLTKIIPLDYEELQISQYTRKVKENREKYWPTKDRRTCAESHLICCSKFNFVLETIKTNPFGTDFFGWIDGNIGEGRNNKICEEYSHDKLLFILSNIKHDKFYLQKMGVVDKKYLVDKRNYYNKYRWLICGCLFLCDSKIGQKILNKLNENFIKTIDFGYGHGEEMIYLDVMEEFYEDFHFSYGDYGQIVNNMLNPTKNIDYIFRCILKPSFKRCYYKESYDCSKVLIKQYSSFKIETNYELYLECLFINFVSSYYYKREKSKCIVENILKLSEENPLMKSVFEPKKSFYMEQFKFVL